MDSPGWGEARVANVPRGAPVMVPELCCSSEKEYYSQRYFHKTYKRGSRPAAQLVKPLIKDF